MKKFIAFMVGVGGLMQVHALVINEIMSNPTGDDNGREWVELYNDTQDTVDLSALTISIKGGNAVVATAVGGGTSLVAGGYAIVGSTVSNATKFLQDYPSYTGPLFKSSISLVNTGVTSIEIKLSGVSADILASYTAAKEGSTLSEINGSFVTASPTPGAENQAPSSDTTQDTTTSTTTATTTQNQVTVAQMSPPSADIVFYMPFEKTVVAGAETEFSTYATNRAGKVIDGLAATWAFGDGGQGTGTSTKYRYAYTGRYFAQVEGTNGYVAGTGRMLVRVVPPDISINGIASGKYGAYIDITNPNPYDLDLSQWQLSIDSAVFPFPKNTLLLSNGTTHFSGLAMGFANITISSSTLIRILFPNAEEVTRYVPQVGEVLGAATTTQSVKVSPSSMPQKIYPKVAVKTVTASTTTVNVKASSSVRVAAAKKDTRIVAFFRSLFGK